MIIHAIDLKDGISDTADVFTASLFEMHNRFALFQPEGPPKQVYILNIVNNCDCLNANLKCLT